MKKFVLIFIVFCGLLCGCQAGDNSDTADYYNDLAKAQEIAAVSAESSSVVKKLTDNEDMDRFIEALNIEGWELKDVPQEAKKTGYFCFSQEQTVKLGQTETDGELYDICKITVYDSPYIDFEIAGLRLSFQVSEDTAYYLNGYF